EIFGFGFRPSEIGRGVAFVGSQDTAARSRLHNSARYSPVILTGAGQNRVAHRVRTSHWPSAKRCTANSGGKVAVAGYRIERSMGCENAASQNMFLNISKCYLNILFVSLIHNSPTS